MGWREIISIVKRVGDPGGKLDQLMEVIVIGTPGSLRNPNLVNQISSFSNVSYVPSVFFAKIPEDLAETNRVNKIFFGRELSLGELGCAAAHRLARSKITLPWALILEDDAQMEYFDSVGVLNILQTADGSSPAIVNLFGNTYTKSKANLTQLRFMPPGTVGYLTSQTVQKLDAITPGTADWPLSFVECRFFYTSAASVSETKSESLVDPLGSRKNRSLRFYLNVFASMPRITILYGMVGLKFGLLMPLIRDLSRLRKP